MSKQLTGLRILITGGNRGIGLALAKKLLSHGNRVCVASRSASLAAELHDQQQQNLLILDCDISCEDKVKEMVASLVDNWGGIDLLINNAAQLHQEPVVSADTAQWMKEIEVNLMGPLYLSKYLLPQMASQKEGVIVNMASMEAVNCTPGLGAYASSKAALIALTRSCAREMAYYPNIIIAGFVPGDINTEMNLTGSESTELAAQRFVDFFQQLQPQHSGLTYMQGEFMQTVFSTVGVK
ncbi:MAG: SDR family oxidoreductase [Sedimenticola sp.]